MSKKGRQDGSFSVAVAGALEESKAFLARLENASQKYDKGDVLGAHMVALEATNDFLLRLGVPVELMRPFVDHICMFSESLGDVTLQLEGKSGPKPKPLHETYVLTEAAAAVTALKRRGNGLPDLIRKISRAVNVEPKELRKFRDKISRRTAPYNVCKEFPSYVQRHRRKSEDEVLNCLRSMRLPSKPVL